MQIAERLESAETERRHVERQQQQGYDDPMTPFEHAADVGAHTVVMP